MLQLRCVTRMYHHDVLPRPEGHLDPCVSQAQAVAAQRALATASS